MDRILERLQRLGRGRPWGNAADGGPAADRRLAEIVETASVTSMAEPSLGKGHPKNVTFCAEGGRRLPARAFVPRPVPHGSGAGPPSAGAAAKSRMELLANLVPLNTARSRGSWDRTFHRMDRWDKLVRTRFKPHRVRAVHKRSRAHWQWQADPWN